MDENEEIELGLNANVITNALVAAAELTSIAYFSLCVKFLYENDFSFSNDSIKIMKMIETICLMWIIQLVSSISFGYFLSSKNTETKKYIFQTSACLYLGALFMTIAVSVLISTTEFTIPSFLNDSQYDSCQQIIETSQRIGKITSLTSVLNFILMVLAMMLAFSQDCNILYY